MQVSIPGASRASWRQDRAACWGCAHRMGCGGDVLLHDQDDVVLRLKGVVELDGVHVVQLVHDTSLVLPVVLGGGAGLALGGPQPQRPHRVALPCPSHAPGLDDLGRQL